MKPGDKVIWIDPITDSCKEGVLVEKNRVMSREDRYGNMVDCDYWVWDVKGDDGKTYGWREEYLEKIGL